MPATDELTLEAILAAIDAAYLDQIAIVDQFADVLDDGPDAAGWIPRQVLSHIIGAWWRVPIHSGHFLAGAEHVTILVGNDYWIQEWDSAPLAAFRAALVSAVEGNRAFVRSLAPADLQRTMYVKLFDEVVTLGEFLRASYEGHLHHFHTPQLRGFLR